MLRDRELFALAPAAVDWNDDGAEAGHRHQHDDVLGGVAEADADEIAALDAGVGKPEADRIHQAVERAVIDAAPPIDDGFLASAAGAR